MLKNVTYEKKWFCTLSVEGVRIQRATDASMYNKYKLKISGEIHCSTSFNSCNTFNDEYLCNRCVPSAATAPFNKLRAFGHIRGCGNINLLKNKHTCAGRDRGRERGSKHFARRHNVARSIRSAINLPRALPHM